MTPQRLIAHYRIANKLGEGGMGEVWRATDTRLNRDVAVKILPGSFAADPDRLSRFTREAHVLASLNHPNIAAIYGVEECALILELVEGPTLAERIAAGPIPVDEALPIARQIAEALEYAHDRGIVHRDLKPANVKVTLEGRVKVLDFGLAKALAVDTAAPADPHSSPTLTMRATVPGLIMGTAAYMSPEQAKGKPVDRRADIWAFGVVLVEMLTGRKVYTGETVSETLASVIKDQPDLASLPPDTPPAIRRLLKRCLDKDQLRRLQAIGEARIAIEAPPADEAPATITPAAPVSRGVPWWVVAVAALVPALALGGVLWRITRPVGKPLQRFLADLGPEAAGSTRVTFAISRDGRRIVHVARAAINTTLATRTLDQRNSTLLTGAASNAADPFVSPDGEWIGFSNAGKVFKISVNGGAPIPLCDTNGFRGASWSEDGYIYATLDLFRVSRFPAAGGKPEYITDSGERADRWPQALPGGEAVLITSSVTRGTYEDADIGVIDLKTRQYKLVQRGGLYGRYLPSGHLVYVHSGTLFAVPFDLRKLQIRGTPVPVLDDVAANLTQGSAQFDFSENGTLVYLTGKGSLDTADVAWLDKSGHVATIVNIPAARTPRLSPDGKLLALSVNNDVFVYDPARSSNARITSGAGATNYPQWMPDGQHLIYTDGDQLNWIRSDGAGKPVPLIKLRGPIPQSISPDGKTIAYTVLGEGRDIYTVSLETSDPEHPKAGNPVPFAVSSGHEADPAFSPDGHWVAYAALQSAGGYQVVVRPFPVSSDGMQFQVSSLPGRFPLWSRAAKELFYVTTEGRIMVVPYAVKGAVFTAGKPEFWSDKTITTTSVATPLDLAPDGKRFVVFPSSDAPQGEQRVNLHAVFLLNFFDELKRRLP